MAKTADYQGDSNRGPHRALVPAPISLVFIFGSLQVRTDLDESIASAKRMALTTGSDSARRSNSERSTSSGGSHRSASGKVCPQCSEVDAFDSDGRTCTKCGVVQEWPLQPELREEGAAEACWHFAAALCIMCIIRRAGAEPYGAGNTSTGIKRKGPTKNRPHR